MRRKSRKAAWERWKRRQVASAPPSRRKWVRELLDGVPAPTAEDERRVEEVRRLVEEAFGKETPRGGDHG